MMNDDDANADLRSSRRPIPVDSRYGLKRFRPRCDQDRPPRPEDRGLADSRCDLRVDSGDRLGVLGPSGAGKTVLLRALALLDPLDAGIDPLSRCKSSSATKSLGYRSQVIYLHQKPALHEGTVEDNLRQPFTLKAHRPTPV